MKISSVKENVDLRSTRNLGTTRGLGRGDCRIYVNRRRTIARVLCHNGVLISCWAPEGERFDVHGIREMIREGIGVDLRATARLAKAA